MTSDERLRAAAEDAIALMSSCYMDTAPGEPDATIAALRAALAAAQPATLDVERLERAMRAHILDDRPGEGWPHWRGGPTPGDGPQDIDGCDDLCADRIAREYDRADTVKGEKD